MAIDDEALAAAAAFGLDESEVAKLRQEAAADKGKASLEVWPENWRPLLLALGMMSQVRTTMNGPIGFDYAALPVVEGRINCPVPTDPEELADDFSAFRHIEQIYFSR